jgi:tRNA U34 2-thiouridine synthase MnmA/TrmU
MRLLNTSTARRRIAVAMSGGVDSSVAAHLLATKNKEDILGIHMSNWDYHGDDDTSKEQKCWEQDWKDSKAVADLLDIPIVHTSFESEYWNSVFDPYITNLSRSITPNPDVDCNRYIKFGVLKEYIRKRFGIDTLATGHYARLFDPTSSASQRPLYFEKFLDENPHIADMLDLTQPVLMAARDTSKDQSYFLSGVTAGAFSNVMFPLGDLLKIPPEDPSNDDDADNRSVREIATMAKLPTASKRDSMGICFIGKRRHADFINEYIPSASKQQDQGKCINVEDGSIVSTFDPSKDLSLVYATIGQGAKLSGAAQKWFVVDKPDPTTILICPGTHHPALYSDSFVVRGMNWIQGCPPTLPLKAQCRIRHLQPLMNCEIRPLPDGLGYEVILEKPFRGIAAGQVCGVYLNDLICIGGGAIAERGSTYLELNKELPSSLHPAGHNDLSAGS